MAGTEMPPNALFSRVSLGTTDTADAAFVVNFVVKTRCNPQVQSPQREITPLWQHPAIPA